MSLKLKFLQTIEEDDKSPVWIKGKEYAVLSEEEDKNGKFYILESEKQSTYQDYGIAEGCKNIYEVLQYNNVAENV